MTRPISLFTGQWADLTLDTVAQKAAAISTHLVGQAVCDPIDKRHKEILPPHVWGDGKSEGVRQRAAEMGR